MTLAQTPPEKCGAIARAYRRVSVLALLMVGAVVAIFFMPHGPLSGPLIMVFPLLFLLLNVLLIWATASLGVKVMSIGRFLSLFLSCFGHLIAAIIFSRLAAAQLKASGYKVGLISATRPRENDSDS